MKTEEQKINYLTRLFEKTYIQDIVERNKVEKVQELDDLINVLASSAGSLTNPSKIQATFKSSIKSDISLNTIRKYIDYLKNAFVISEANRYDGYLPCLARAGRACRGDACPCGGSACDQAALPGPREVEATTVAVNVERLARCVEAGFTIYC